MADQPPGPWVILGSRFVVEDRLPDGLRDPLIGLLQGFFESHPPAGHPPMDPVRVHVVGPVLGVGGITFREGGRSPERISVDPLEASAVEYAIVRRAVHLVQHQVVLHAASVQHRAGSTLILGESGMGKTTLALLLHAAGCPLLSDDLSPLDPVTGGISAFPRSPRLDGDPPPEVWAAVRPPPEGFPLHRAPFPGGDRGGRDESFPVTRIVVLDRSGPGEGIEALSRSDAVQVLLRSVIRGRSTDFSTLVSTLAGTSRRAPAFRIRSTTPRAALEAALRVIRS